MFLHILFWGDFIYNLVKIIYIKNIINNINVIKNKINKKYMFVAKAESYSNDKIIEFIEKYVDSFAVFNLEEAIKLREKTSKDILLLSSCTCEIDYYVKYNITASFYRFEDLFFVENKLKEQGKSIKLHLPINSGMNRFGVNNNADFEKILDFINISKCINLTGIYTHLSSENNSNVKYQMEKFYAILGCYNTNNIDIHFISSTYLDNNYLLTYKSDSIRIGIANYTKSIESTMNSVEIYSKILDIKIIKKGEIVGYFNNFVANSESKIAIISGGYFDGINSNLIGYNVKINNNYCKTIGKICMDVFFVDVTNINCVVGDIVKIISTTDDNLSIGNMANYLGVSKQEVLSKFRGRIKTIYKNN